MARTPIVSPRAKPVELRVRERGAARPGPFLNESPKCAYQGAWLVRPGSTCWNGRYALVCAVQQQHYLVTAMLPFFVYFLNRKRAFHWSPSVDLSDPYIAAALAPMSHS